MSGKINSKNLSYDSTLPPFLARLRANQAESGASRRGPDPILAAQRRPGQRVRTASEEAEDAPIVVDEDGNVVVLKEGENIETGTPQADESTDAERTLDSEGDPRRDKEKEKTAGIGASRKRKAGRVIGSSGDDDQGDTKKPGHGAHGLKKAITQEKQATSTSNYEEKNEHGVGATNPITKPKKKAKKIKLSFGDDEE